VHEVKLSAYLDTLKSNDESAQRSQRPHVTGQWESTPTYLQNFKTFPLFLICLHVFESLLPLPSSVVNWNLLSSQKVEGVEDGLVDGKALGLTEGVTLGKTDGLIDGNTFGADDGVIVYFVQ